MIGGCIRRTLFALVVLKGLEGGERRAAGEKLVRELALVLLELLVVLLCLIWNATLGPRTRVCLVPVVE